MTGMIRHVESIFNIPCTVAAFADDDEAGIVSEKIRTYNKTLVRIALVANDNGVNLFLADACPLLCKLSTRQIARTLDNGGSDARARELRDDPHELLNHPIVSVPNQPEIPAFVASVFTKRATRDARDVMERKKKTRRGPSTFRRN